MYCVFVQWPFWLLNNYLAIMLTIKVNKQVEQKSLNLTTVVGIDLCNKMQENKRLATH